MAKQKQIDVWIDKLTNSIVNTISGESFPTSITLVKLAELKSVTKANGWNFNWKAEVKKNDLQVYKLTTRDNPTIIHGLVSLKLEEDHVFVSIIENAPFNIGKTKLYKGVPANLFAYACKVSWDFGNQGAVAFVSKTRLLEHYEQSLGAVHLGNSRMVILPMDALNLIRRYFLNQK
ncbi:MAG: hypothetical protein IPN86_17405 [Saprospiraceae bacterium]|nr:hypothetical protein [Saprospiraceae bacterium]